MPPLLYKRLNLFPLQRLIKGNNTHYLAPPPPENKNLLLAQVPSLDRELVEQLEMARIFDTNDFFDAIDQLEFYLGINENKITDIKIQIQNAVTPQTYNSIEIQNDLPENHMFLSMASDTKFNVLSFIWKNFEITLANPVSEGWNLVKFEFDILCEKFDKPEIIIKYSNYDKWPTWLDVAMDIGYYLHLPSDDVLTTLFSSLDLPIHASDALSVARLNSLHMAFLVSSLQNKHSQILVTT